MDFALFTFIGIAAGLAHLWIPGEHRLGPASAFVLGILGALNGAIVAGAFVPGMLASLSSGLATAGSIVGAVGTLAFMELAIDAYFRHHPGEDTR
jgi:uncharacterized membrane protein YeaQ/YmgE (transglycosylase-associated protein family)